VPLFSWWIEILVARSEWLQIVLREPGRNATALHHPHILPPHPV
jgi:hypothetical protein